MVQNQDFGLDVSDCSWTRGINDRQLRLGITFDVQKKDRRMRYLPLLFVVLAKVQSGFGISTLLSHFGELLSKRLVFTEQLRDKLLESMIEFGLHIFQ
jgi:hypothetical protein